MDPVRREVLDDIEVVLARFARAVRSDMEAAEAWMAWSAVAAAVRSGSLTGAPLDSIAARARRVSGVALSA